MLHCEELSVLSGETLSDNMPMFPNHLINLWRAAPSERQKGAVLHYICRDNCVVYWGEWKSHSKPALKKRRRRISVSFKLTYSKFSRIHDRTHKYTSCSYYIHTHTDQDLAQWCSNKGGSTFMKRKRDTEIVILDWQHDPSCVDVTEELSIDSWKRDVKVK